ncbi:MAG: bifunctional demethylmenaquinone methyltransferase/2-methoxy-6-polyprenyl-1,4-benzoquinol methylase UbiE [Pseudomonadota bacterium]
MNETHVDSAVSIQGSSDRSRASGEMETSYGFQAVKPGEKQGRVDQVFHKVAGRYDLMNDLMSVGMHRLWKNAAVSFVSPSRTAPWRGLDVAGGTGDIAFRLVDASGGNAHVTVLDINGSMLEVGADRARRGGMENNTEFVEANAEELPFEDKSFDAYTIALGIRNVPRIDKALSEARRVLKTGGKFMCLEFSAVDFPGFDRVYDAWSFNAIPPIGRIVTGDAEPYQYLVESIRKFPDQERFAGMIRDAGFSQVKYRNFNGGIVAMHTGHAF